MYLSARLITMKGPWYLDVSDRLTVLFCIKNILAVLNVFLVCKLPLCCVVLVCISTVLFLRSSCIKRVVGFEIVFDMSEILAS